MTGQRVRLPNADHPITVAPAGRRVVVRAGDAVLADSSAALTLSEAGYPPVHYIPREAVDMARLDRSAHATWCPYKGDASYFSVPLLGDRAANAVWTYERPHGAVKEIAGHLAFHADRFTIEVR